MKACIKLLPKDYQFDFCDFNIHSNKLKYIISILHNILKFIWITLKDGYYILRGKTIGCCGNYDFIDIYAFNYIENEYFKVEMVFGLYHEVRHLWQRQHKFKKYDHKKLSVTNIRYSSQDAERDANRFAARMCNQHLDKISKILNIDNEWECIM